MRHRSLLIVLALATSLLVTTANFAAKSYQVTGTVVKLTDKIITVQKADDEKWEIDRDDNTKVTGDLKVGAKVTIEYKMTASKVEVKDD
jgi:hypothetical protein